MAGISAWRRTPTRRGPYVARAVAELRSWPSLALSDTGQQIAFTVRGTEILRLAGRDEIHVRLTAPAIGRLEPYLHACDQIHACRDRAWVAVQVDAEPDLELLLALTSVAIKAHVA
ncbi:luciferase family protein [Nonomuraea spiralis]|uniref:Luciferase family protein n=1 Tax=Nonomuraea spiralis TaxID=46182 RepID=A0ABV5IKA8_9ACTN|nr:luciferase family protein [Nonomuraea spiralis]